MLSIIIITRSVGPDQFGLYAASLALAKITSIVFSLGMSDWLLRNGNLKAQSIGLPERLTGSLVVQFSLGLVWLGLLSATAPHLDIAVYPTTLLLIVAITVWLEELVFTALTAFKVALDNRVTARLMIILQLLNLGPLILLMILETNTVTPFIIARGITTIFGAVGGIFFAFRRFSFRLHKTTILQSLRETMPFAASMALVLLYERVDVTIIAGSLGQEAAGLYAPAVSLVLALTLAPAAIHGVMVPTMSRLFIENVKTLPGIATRSIIWSALLGLFLGGGLAIGSRPLTFLLYGPDYGPLVDILIILSGVLFLRTVSFGLAAIIVTVGLQNMRVIAQAAAALSNIVFNLLIVKEYGISGVAFVYCLSETILMLGYALIVVKWLRTIRNTP
ncbi:MAG: oligosaccharide flippase family protein [Caldilineaceae bacterium]|nr:oligosaccharide flippase family protein [Caldilineaceae bacterium]